MTFHPTSPAVIRVLLSCVVLVVQDIFLLNPFLSYSPAPSQHAFTPLFSAPRPFPYCSEPGRNSHTPVFHASTPPPKLQPAWLTEDRQRGRKTKKKALTLSVSDYRLLLSTSNTRLALRRKRNGKFCDKQTATS